MTQQQAESIISFNEALSQIHEIINSELLPLEQDKKYLDFLSMQPALDLIRERVKKKGLWMPHIPQNYGGMGFSYESFAQISAVLGRSPYGHYVFNCQAPDAGNLEILIEFATEKQKETFLNPLLKGDIRSCFAMTEPDNAGSNPLLLESKAEKVDGGYILNGRKWFTTGADQSAFAISMFVTDKNANDPRTAATLFLVPTNSKGFKHIRKISVMGEEGSGWGSHSEVLFENCFVPEENILGKVGEGFKIAQSRLGPGRIHHCMRWMGICDRVLEMICSRVSNRKIGPDTYLSSKQLVQNIIADNYANIRAAKLMVLDVAKKMDHNHHHEVKADISCIKFFCAKVLRKILDDAVQVHGAYGISDDSLVAFWYRHERGASIYDGPDEVHQQVCARELLSKYRKPHIF